MTENPYKVLGVDQAATVDEIKAAAKHSIAVAELALDLLEFYDFESDPPEPMYAPAGMTYLNTFGGVRY